MNACSCPALKRGAYSEVATIPYAFATYLALGFDMRCLWDIEINIVALIDL